LAPETHPWAQWKQSSSFNKEALDRHTHTYTHTHTHTPIQRHCGKSFQVAATKITKAKLLLGFSSDADADAVGDVSRRPFYLGLGNGIKGTFG